jgi:hypothetical protein
LAAGAGAMVLFGAGSAGAAPPPCDLMITACGCVITTPAPDVYQAANDLSASQTEPNCIEIAAARAILNLKGKHVTGNGSGIGILIRKSADHVIVEGADEAVEANPQATVSEWDVGIRDDGDDAVIVLFKDIGGHLLGAAALPGPTPGNNTGVLLNAVKHSVAADFRTGFNNKNGVVVRNSSDINLFNFSTLMNKDNGAWLDSSNNSVVGSATSTANTNQGIWLRSSVDNLIIDSGGVASNGKAGILLGGGHKSNDNVVTNSGGSGNKLAGIEIDTNNRDNIVTVNTSSGNGSGKAAADMVDQNSKCDDNRWYNNKGTGNQPCIQ